MFQSLNLFKSINCPYYSSTTNTLTCDRPHCQFKHPSIHSSNASKQNVEVIEQSKLSTPQNEPNKSLDNNLNQLPSMLENISNALQTVQQIISSSNMGDSLSKFNTNSSNQTASQISATLANLNNVLQSVSTKQDSQNLEKSQSSANTPIKKSSSFQKNLKRQQSAPDYNPTPIEELKKRAEVDLSPTSLNDEEEGYKRRKCGNESPINELVKNDVKKLKVEELATANSIQNKCDLVSFSKLSLSQQVLKRYEMLNKPAPTTAAIIEAKLKKHQANSTAKSNTEPINQNVPHLIIDSNPNSANKIPLVMRQRYLKVIFENGKSSFTTIQKACEKAAEQEKSIYDRAKNKTIYTNLAANLIRSLRTQSQQQISSAPATKPAISLKNPLFKPKIIQPAPTPSFSHETMLSGHKANKCSYSINRVKQLEFKDLSMSQLYKIFYSYVLTEKQLDDNSFPKWTDDKQLAFIPNLTKSNDKKTENKPKGPINNEIINQTCKRCNKTFNLRSKDLFYLTSNSECVFHWGKLRNVRVDKAIEHKYSCCSGGLDSDGCEVGKHVYDGDYNGNGNGSNLTGYFQVNNDYSDSKTLNIYALDCEMCYTTKGLELTRITIVDINSKEVYESLVKPDTQILDYNTRWSGVTEQSLRNCNKKIKHVQADLAKLFNRDTILIGHSLESDFKALKLIHTKVIDTSVVFPHKMGPPYKRALRNLMSEHLQKIIQEDTEGHDSKEDAASCVSLMIWKINEDLRTKKFNDILNESNSMKTNSLSLNSPRSLTNSKIK